MLLLLLLELECIIMSWHDNDICIAHQIQPTDTVSHEFSYTQIMQAMQGDSVQ